MKILCLKIKDKIYRVSVYPGSCGHILSLNNNKFRFPNETWKIIGFSVFRSKVRLYSEDTELTGNIFNEIDRSLFNCIESLNNHWVWDRLGRYNRRWVDRIDRAFIEEADPEEVAKIVKARILK